MFFVVPAVSSIRGLCSVVITLALAGVVVVGGTPTSARAGAEKSPVGRTRAFGRHASCRRLTGSTSSDGYNSQRRVTNTPMRKATAAATPIACHGFSRT